MSCQCQGGRREVSEVIAGLSGQKSCCCKVNFSYIGVDELVNGRKDVLMSLDIVECSRSVFFYPENISQLTKPCP